MSSNIDWATLNSHQLTLVASTGFTVASQSCGYITIANKTVVFINAQINGSIPSNSATEICTIPELPLRTGSATPQLSAEATLGWGTSGADGNAAVGCWIRERTKAITVETYRASASLSNTSIRITGAYIF